MIVPEMADTDVAGIRATNNTNVDRRVNRRIQASEGLGPWFRSDDDLSPVNYLLLKVGTVN